MFLSADTRMILCLYACTLTVPVLRRNLETGESLWCLGHEKATLPT